MVALLLLGKNWMLGVVGSGVCVTFGSLRDPGSMKNGNSWGLYFRLILKIIKMQVLTNKQKTVFSFNKKKNYKIGKA